MFSLFKRRRAFGEIAVAKGYITKRQLEKALAAQKSAAAKGLVRKKIGAILLEKGFVEIDEIAKILEEQQKGTFWSWVGAFFSLKRGI